jgi:hypothetical protein
VPKRFTAFNRNRGTALKQAAASTPARKRLRFAKSHAIRSANCNHLVYVYGFAARIGRVAATSRSNALYSGGFAAVMCRLPRLTNVLIRPTVVPGFAFRKSAVALCNLWTQRAIERQG